MEFVLFPMIHVGDKGFYDEIGRRLSECDLILVEGINSKKVSLLTLSYRVVKWIKRMDLITQQEGLKLSEYREKIIRSDMDGTMFDQHWSELSISLRLTILAVLPFYVAHLLLRGSRVRLAEGMTLDDLPSRDEELMYDERYDEFDELVIAERDRTLIDKIEDLRSSNQTQRKVVGVLYGAGHMRGITNYLMNRLRYQVAEAEWVTVFYL